VTSQDADLERGSATAVLRMPQAGVAVLSASFDSGWTARVDGRPAKVLPVAPALVATRIPAGTHRVAFRYAGFSDYWVLLLLAALSVAVLAVIDHKRRARERCPSHARAQVISDAKKRRFRTGGEFGAARPGEDGPRSAPGGV
jgi:hypothetical protein